MDTLFIKRLKMTLAGIFVFVIGIGLSVNYDTHKTSGDINLAKLAFISEARGAEEDDTDNGWFWQARTESCTYTVTVTVGGGAFPGSWTRTDTYSGTRTVCFDGWSVCWSTMCS